MPQDLVATALADAKVTLVKCSRHAPAPLNNEITLRLQSIERGLLEHARSADLRRVVAEAVQTALATEFAARRAPLTGWFATLREKLFGAKES